MDLLLQIERDAQEMADNLGVKIFSADIIYHLFDKFTAFREELRQKKREEFKHIAVFPCKIKVSDTGYDFNATMTFNRIFIPVKR